MKHGPELEQLKKFFIYIIYTQKNNKSNNIIYIRTNILYVIYTILYILYTIYIYNIYKRRTRTMSEVSHALGHMMY